MNPSAETNTPLAKVDSSADSSHVRKSTLLAKRLKIVSADISREELSVLEAFEVWGAPRTARCGQTMSNGNKTHDRTIRPELRLPSKVPLYMAS